uniref:hypothetical protein n=1 Tax=Fulvivirga sp. TaxID=1931237 RepID=UPI004049BE3C
MAKRLVRYNSTKSILDNASEITGKKVNIVFRNGQVSFALATSISNNEIVYKNMRNASQKADLENIAEIIIDLNA